MLYSIIRRQVLTTVRCLVVLLLLQLQLQLQLQFLQHQHHQQQHQQQQQHGRSYSHHSPSMSVAALPRWIPGGLVGRKDAANDATDGNAGRYRYHRRHPWILSEGSTKRSTTTSSSTTANSWKRKINTIMRGIVEQDVVVMLFLLVGIVLLLHCWKARFQQ